MARPQQDGRLTAFIVICGRVPGLRSAKQSEALPKRLVDISSLSALASSCFETTVELCTLDQIADIADRSASRQPQILPVRQRAILIDEMVRERLETILPRAMRDAGLDAWLVICQEDNPDPVYATMIPMDTWSPIMSMLLFIDDGTTVRRYNIGGVATKGPLRTAL